MRAPSHLGQRLADVHEGRAARLWAWAGVASVMGSAALVATLLWRLLA